MFSNTVCFLASLGKEIRQSMWGWGLNMAPNTIRGVFVVWRYVLKNVAECVDSERVGYVWVRHTQASGGDGRVNILEFSG